MAKKQSAGPGYNQTVAALSKARKNLIRQRRRNRVIRFLLILSSLALIGYMVYLFYLQPQSAYQTASQLFEEGRYEEAAQAFSALNNWNDAPDMVRTASYRAAEQYADEGRYAAAVEKYQSLGSWQGATDEADSLIYRAGEEYVQGGEYEKALELYRMMSKPEERDMQVAMVTMIMAESAAEEGNLDEAIALYRSLGDRRDAVNKADQLVLQKGDELFEIQAYDEAITVYRQVNGRLDSLARITQANYLKAELLEKEGDISSAASIYLSLGEYEEAPQRGMRLRYLEAQEAYEKGQYEHASDLFTSLGDYEDAALRAANAALKAEDPSAPEMTPAPTHDPSASVTPTPAPTQAPAAQADTPTQAPSTPTHEPTPSPVPTPTGEPLESREARMIERINALVDAHGPISLHVASKGKKNVYTNESLEEPGTIGQPNKKAWTGSQGNVDDEIHILAIGRNHAGTLFARVEYPASNSWKEAYMELADLIPDPGPALQGPAPVNLSPLYSRPGARAGKLSVPANVEILVLGSEVGFTQIIAPQSGVWWAYWCDSELLDELTDPEEDF
ncbi:MAG: tetratricopeptide repeat protein [Clostridia bacterium]|nr:tetratricopeptide repeat protein [Clostridia bacterium]